MRDDPVYPVDEGCIEGIGEIGDGVGYFRAVLQPVEGDLAFSSGGDACGGEDVGERQVRADGDALGAVAEVGFCDVGSVCLVFYLIFVVFVGFGEVDSFRGDLRGFFFFIVFLVVLDLVGFDVSKSVWKIDL